MVYRNTKALTEADELGHDKEDLSPNADGFDEITPEKLFGFNPELGLTRSEELASDSSYSDFFRDPKVMQSFTEHLDLTDKITRRAIMTMNEAEQSSVLTTLTSKLYDNIVAKVDDIDYGDIPNSKGDITKLPNYDKLVECIQILHDILKEYKQDTGPIDVVSEALANVTTRKDLFSRAFKYNVEMPIIMYNNTVLAIISGVSYMIATSIEFIKTPNKDSFQITLDKVAYAKTKHNMLYNNLKKFNKACASKEFDKTMEHVIQNRIHGVGESVMREFTPVAIGVGVVAGILLVIIPILKELVFFFYYSRMRVSEFFDIQADLLQLNAYKVQANSEMDEEKKGHIINKQFKVAELFRKIANKISFSNRKAEVETTKELSASSKKMKLDDISDELPDNVASSLF